MGKKSKKSVGGDSPPASESPPLAPVSSLSTSKKGKVSPAPTAPSPSSSALVICRNKHWRYISSFHGPWLQLPLEVIETLANANYYMPLPRPVDPAVFYDLVKIRQLVDAATDLAVRAASGVASSTLSNSLAGGAAHQMQALGLGFGSAGGAKLSPERRFRMREQATQKLSKAYHLDEIASSVATMQSTSTLENVAGLVLQRAPSDPDANYVHFFHEKIPSRQLAECTDFRALDLIIGQRPSDSEPLRTRAVVRMFKDDFEGAAQDLTTALSICRLQQPLHREENMQLERRTGRRRDQPPLDEQDQPSSTEVQLLFQRAGCYLTLACNHVESSALAVIQNGSTPNHTPSLDDTANCVAGSPANGENLVQGTGDAKDKGPTKKELEHRKYVRLYAKRALRDYMEYLKHFHYSPNFPIEISDDFTRQVNQATNKTKRYYGGGGSSRWSGQDPSSPATSVDAHTVHELAALFSATPPADLPPYPSTDLVARGAGAEAEHQPIQTVTESVTYHPLLTDALHSLLLCHALIQTSAKELQRHAYMVARLARLADGYPVFQASRSPARADWIEVLRRADNWIELSGSWEALCAPAPLPAPPSLNNGVAAASAGFNALAINGNGSSGGRSLSGVNGGANGGVTGPSETEEQRKDRLRHQAIIEALEDERVNDEASFKAAILARQRRAEADQTVALVPSSNISSTSPAGPAPPPTPPLPLLSASSPSPAPSAATPKRWAVDDGREYPILTERAEAVARWVRDAPAGAGAGTGKRKKKPAMAKKVASSLVKHEAIETQA